MPIKRHQAREYFSMRMRSGIHSGLVRRAQQLGQSKSSLAERYIGEGLRQDLHPEIVFRDGPFGRRALLGGTRLEVWQVIETVRNSDDSLEEAARYLTLPLTRVRACLAYYAQYKDEVDDYAARIVIATDEAEAAWRREQELIGA